MNIGAVRRVHQPHNGVVDVGVEHHPVDELGLAANDPWDVRRRLVGLAIAPGIAGHPDEDQPLRLGHGIGAHADAADVDLLILDHRRDRRTDPVGAKPPAVIGALDHLPAADVAHQPPGGKRRRPVRADVAQGVDRAVVLAAEQDRLAEDLVALQLAGTQVAGEGGEVPDVAQEAAAEPRSGRPPAGGSLVDRGEVGLVVCGRHVSLLSEVAAAKPLRKTTGAG